MLAARPPPKQLNDAACPPASTTLTIDRRKLLAAIVCQFILHTAAWAGQNDEPSIEYQVKAAFLYKFVGYVDWPEQVFTRPNSPVTIGILGSEALVNTLSQITAGREINGRSIEVRKIQRGAPTGNLHVLYVTQSNESIQIETIGTVKGQSVLIVTENEKGLADGGMINFVVEGDKVRFDIALPNAEQSKLKISARLLGVARRVISKPS